MTTMLYIVTIGAMVQELKRGLVVAKKLVVNDFRLVVNSDLASCKSQTK